MGKMPFKAMPFYIFTTLANPNFDGSLKLIKLFLDFSFLKPTIYAFA